MMGIYIKGIDMPTKGNPITVAIYPDGTAEWEAQHITGSAVPVPPHGDLIDRDKFREYVFIGEQCLYSWDEIEDVIDYAPTIIPAEEGE